VKIFSGIAAFSSAHLAARPAGGVAVAIGNFDGVHLGHRRLLDEARARAARAGASSAVLTFMPHPARLFAPDRAPPLILSLERRLELLAEAGIEIAVVEPFTHAFAAVEADAFVKDALVRDLGAREVVVGYDFTFGRERTGDINRLAALGGELGFGVAVVPQVTIDGVACSSTKIRELVVAGRTIEAARLLGRPYEVEGKVTRGAGRGRAIGFPTANLAPDAELRPALGIYAARARLLDGPLAGQAHVAALSVGRNPTFVDAGAVTIEAYLLDFEGDLYDRRLRLEIGERLRDEQRFESVEALVAQIRQDVARVRALS
jgi:riboflavin kinase/FMN adenylyltransferase